VRFYDLPKGNVRSRHPDTPNMAVEVTGPLGERDSFERMVGGQSEETPMQTRRSRTGTVTNTDSHADFTPRHVSGQLTVPLPPYLHAQHDESARKISVRVDDAAEKHQRAMWGKQKTLHSTCLRKDSSLRRHRRLAYSHH
jgi:hypothetical protein